MTNYELIHYRYQERRCGVHGIPEELRGVGGHRRGDIQ